ncbi:MAG TPA: Imm1 family immunity protein [Pseudonocardiaceae bacterium]|jgi:hypothetical protein
MTFIASVPTDHDDEGGFTLTVALPAEVTNLVTRLVTEETGTAHIEGETADYVVQAHVEHDFGYLFYVDDRSDAAYSVGDPRSPGIESSEQSFPAGSGVGLDVFDAALRQLLDTDGRPTAVSWRAVDIR